MRSALSLLLVSSLVASAQQPAHVEPPVYVTAIEVVAEVRDAAGNLPPGLTAADFILIEDGVERSVIGVDYLNAEQTVAVAGQSPSAPAAIPAKPWQTVLYFETDLSNGSGRRQTAKELLKHVDKLVQMGTVDVIFANPRPAAILKNSRDPEAVRKALQTVLATSGFNQLARHRQQFLREVTDSTGMQAAQATSQITYEWDAKAEKMVKVNKPLEQNPSNMSSHVTRVEVKKVKPYIEQEIQIINRFRRNLLSWMSNYGHYAPRTLMMVTDGFDLDPLEYYSASLNKGDELELKSYVAQAALKDNSAKLAKTLATAGWRTVSIQGDSPTSGWLDDASTNAVGRVHKSAFAQPQSGPRSILFRPAEPLQEVADETGGEVVGNSGRIAKAIARLDDRLRITYQVDRKPDGKPVKIEIKARDKSLKVRSARWAAASTPDEMAEQRALGQLHEGATFTGDLPVEATVEWTANTDRKRGTLRVVSKLPGADLRGDFRFTLAILVLPGEAFVTHKPLNAYRLSNGEFRLQTPLDLPAATSVVVIAIEDLANGMWGSSRIKVQ